MAKQGIRGLMEAEAGRAVVLQGNLAFALGCARGGIHAADGYPGTPSTEVIDKGLRHLQDVMRVGWSVNEANATGVGLGCTMAGFDCVVTMKIPGLFQAADVVATAAGYTAPRGGLVLYVASDFVPSSTQYVTDPRYFLKSCLLPVLEPRNHQEMMTFGPLAASLSRRFATPVVVLASAMLCHSEGLTQLIPRGTVERASDTRFERFMNLPEIARRNYDTILAERIPGLQAWGQTSDLNRITWNDRSLGIVTHGATELLLREVWSQLPIKPSILSVAMTYPLPSDLLRSFVEGIHGPVIVLEDGLRFVQEEMLALGLRVEGKTPQDSTTEWTPDQLATRLGAVPRRATAPAKVEPVRRPPNLCAGCPYRAFGLAVQFLRKKKKIVASFGDIGCNTLLYFLQGIDTCTCMGASEAERQGAVIADPSLAGKTISVLGDSTECHSGMDATRNAIFRNLPGVKVVLDNFTTAMTGGQPAPSSPRNLAGQPMRFNLVNALRGEGATVREVDAFDMRAIDVALRESLAEAEKGQFTVLVLRGACMQEVPADQRRPRYELVAERCKQCDLCLVCPGVEKDDQGLPRFTHLCNGCGGNVGVCVQRCHLDAIVPFEVHDSRVPAPALPPLPVTQPQAVLDTLRLPASMRVAIRGVGGQGNLFLGKVLAEVALRAGFKNVIKGETHGMAQLGGAVVSTFACGDVHAPVFSPASVDALVALELSEVLRPGFLSLLKPGGVVLLNATRLVPPGVDPAAYPSPERIREFLGPWEVVEFDALTQARALGDLQGRSSNVIALGLLSTVEPFCRIPVELWHEALFEVSGSDVVKRANLAAFERGRTCNRP